MPPRNGWRALGMRMEPSFCWLFSMMAMRVRPMAKAVASFMKTKAEVPSARLSLVLRRRDWKSVTKSAE